MKENKERDYVLQKKSLGQHFLSDRRVAERMVKTANIGTEDMVLEVGPGRGFLTGEILRSGARVVAVETDARMIEAMKHDFKNELEAGQLILRECDIRNTSPQMLGLKNREYTVIANIPYFLSGFLFRFFLSADAQPANLVFLVQKEIAERIAREKKSSLLSLSVRAYGTPKYIKTVRPGSFSPPPRVNSAILSVRNISRDHFQNTSEAFFFDILHLGFKARRKQLLGNLAREFDRDTLVHIFSTLGISHKVRGEDLPLETWLTLADALSIHSS